MTADRYDEATIRHDQALAELEAAAMRLERCTAELADAIDDATLAVRSYRHAKDRHGDAEAELDAAAVELVDALTAEALA